MTIPKYRAFLATGMSDTSITCEGDTKERLRGLKREDETWSDLLERLADSLEASQEVAQRLDTIEAAVRSDEGATNGQEGQGLPEGLEYLRDEVGQVPERTADLLEQRFR